MYFKGFPGGAMVKNLPANAGDPDSIPGSGRAPGDGNGNPLQYSCLENSMDRGFRRDTVHGDRKELDMTEHALLHINGKGWNDKQPKGGGI